eukprot:jgi/Picsp_1/3560/NSC_06397-R2_fructose- -bisphosphatase
MSLEACLELLKGPSDERRFVGLLMITKTIDPSDSGARRRVYETVGGGFLSRLLLPLRAGRVHPKPLTDDDVNHQVALACLGLSVMSNLSADVEVASSSAVRQTIPLALLVIQNKGIRKQLCQYTKSHVEIDLSAEIRAVVDALNICMNAMGPGLDSALSTDDSGSYVAAAEIVLTWITDELFKSLDISQMDLLTDLIESAMKFCHASLSHLLRQSLDDNNEACQKAVGLIPALSHFFASPSCRCSILEISDVSKDSRRKKILIDAHLVALHSLAMIVSLVETFSYHWEAYNHLMTGGKDASWLEDIKVGIEVVLTGKMVERERYMALILTAAMLELLGSKWLHPADKHGLHFYQVLVQTVRVELGVLLLDAMSPEASVLPSYSVSLFDSSNTPGNIETGKSSFSSKGISNKGKEPIEVEIPVPMEPPPPPGSLVSKVEELEISGSRSEEEKATKLVSYSTVSSAGERVLKELPVSLVIFEYLIEVLAEDDFPSVAISVPTSSKFKAFEAIMESAEVLLQFIEQKAFYTKENSISLDGQLETLILACWRALGRFCAEAPDPLSERIQKIVPVLFDILSDPTNAFHCFLPMMVQVIDTTEDSSNPTRESLQGSWSQAIATKHILSLIAQDLIDTCRIISSSEENGYEVMGLWRRIDLDCSLLVGVLLNKSLPARSVPDAWEYWRLIAESPYIFEALQNLFETVGKTIPEEASDDVLFLGETAAGMLSLLCTLQTFSHKKELPINLGSEEIFNICIFITMLVEHIVLSGSLAAMESIPKTWKNLAESAAQLAKFDEQFANHVSQRGVPMMEIVNLLN